MTTDARMHGHLDDDRLRRVFGSEYRKELRANGFNFNDSHRFETREVVEDLKKRAFSFVFCVGNEGIAREYGDLFGYDHCIVVPSTSCLPMVEGAIIGLTEGTLQPLDVRDYLERHGIKRSGGSGRASYSGLSDCEVDEIIRQLSNIPFNVANGGKAKVKVPRKNDILPSKTEYRVIGRFDSAVEADEIMASDGSAWL